MQPESNMDESLKIDFSKIPFSKDQESRLESASSDALQPETGSMSAISDALRNAVGSLADTSTLDFIAYLFMQDDCKEKGLTPFPWLKCDPELQRQYLVRAANAYMFWIGQERTSQINRAT